MPENLQRMRRKTNTATPDDSYAEGEPIVEGQLATMPLGYNRALVWLLMVDGDDEVLPDTEPTTLAVTVVPTMEGRRTAGADPVRVVGEASPLDPAAWPVRRCISLAMPEGASFALQLGALVDPPAGIAALEAWWLPYRA
jgi:hypothetical protein